MNTSGTYFVLFPADDASRISLFTTSDYKCVYTTPVPQISEVISLDKHIIVGTQGWGSLYTIDLPEKTTPGGSFDPDSVVEAPNYTPSYPELIAQLANAAPYFYKPANSVGALSSSNIIYYLLKACRYSKSSPVRDSSEENVKIRYTVFLLCFEISICHSEFVEVT